jgi:O-acetyl-ADP-ribose deacetylase (regulator of RNase III)
MHSVPQSALLTMDRVQISGGLCQARFESFIRSYFWEVILNQENSGSNKVVLTCVGGGVFGDKLSWIAEAMASAITKTDGYGLDIIIGHYSSEMASEFKQYAEQAGIKF